MKKVFLIGLVVLMGLPLLAEKETQSMDILGYNYGGVGTYHLEIYDTSTLKTIVTDDKIQILPDSTSSYIETFAWVMTGTIKSSVKLSFDFSLLYNKTAYDSGTADTIPCIPLYVQLYPESTKMASSSLGSSGATIGSYTYKDSVSMRGGSSTSSSGIQFDLEKTSISKSSLSGSHKYGYLSYSLETSNGASTVPQWTRSGKGFVKIDTSDQGNQGSYQSDVAVTITAS